LPYGTIIGTQSYTGPCRSPPLEETFVRALGHKAVGKHVRVCPALQAAVYPGRVPVREYKYFISPCAAGNCGGESVRRPRVMVIWVVMFLILLQEMMVSGMHVPFGYY
jgi:hypothetical protein